MNAKLILPLTLLGLALAGCPQVDPPAPDECEDVRFNDPAFPPSVQDEFTLKSAVVAGNELTLNVSYGGGCDADKIDFDGWMEELPTAGPIPQYRIHVTLKDEDYCEALLTRDICFDLAPAGKSAIVRAGLTIVGPKDTVFVDWE